MKPYRKNYAPKSRQEVAGANDHCWIPEMQKRMSKEGKKNYDINYRNCFGHD